MDRDNKLLKIILFAIAMIVIIFSIKFLYHKKEVASLLKEQDITKVYNTESRKYSSDKENKGYKQEFNKNKLMSSSESVSKKTKDSKDFITENEAINDENRSIDVSKKSLESKINYDNKELDLLSRLIYSEAGNEPYMGKVAVGNVVLYRSQQNNQSIEKIIFSRNQFDGVNTGNFNREPDNDSKMAALEVLSGIKAIEDGYFFANLNLCSPGWAKEKSFICRIGDHWFFRKE